MPETRTILFAGGGTGGHLYPGVAVAQAMQARWPNYQPLFLCTTKEIDKTILEPTGFEYRPQPIQPLPKVSEVSRLLRFWSGWRRSRDQLRQVIQERRPVAVLGLGGYAAGVAVKLASEAGLPTAILNPDVIPGRANQYLMGFSKLVCCQFDQTAEYVSLRHRALLETTGCPIRSDIAASTSREDALVRLELDPMLRTLVVTGASLGAKTVNDAVLQMLKDMTLHGWQILHLTGKDHVSSVREGYHGLEQPARVLDFTPAMADVWAVADLAISRSGASSCAELTAMGVPSILLPYPFHKDLHQRANAKVLADAHAAVLIDDEKDAHKNAAKLRAAIEPLLHDAPARQAMRSAALKLAKPDAANRVALRLAELADQCAGPDRKTPSQDP